MQVKPAGWSTVARNGLLAALALFALLAGDAASQYSVFDWIWRWETRALLSLVMGAIALLLAAVGTMAFLSLMHSYGKVLVRIERLESALAEAGIDLGLEPGALNVGLAPGAPAPAIGVVGATGEKISLAELWGSGTPVMQLFGLLAILHALTPNWSNGEMRVHVADHNIKFDHLPVYADFVFGGTGGGDGGGEMPILGVRIASLLANPEGVNQGRESITLINQATSTIDLSGWKLRDRAAGEAPVFGQLATGARTTVILPRSLALNNGDEVALIGSDGIERHRVSYTRDQVLQGQEIDF